MKKIPYSSSRRHRCPSPSTGSPRVPSLRINSSDGAREGGGGGGTVWRELAPSGEIGNDGACGKIDGNGEPPTSSSGSGSGPRATLVNAAAASTRATTANKHRFVIVHTVDGTVSCVRCERDCGLTISDVSASHSSIVHHTHFPSFVHTVKCEFDVNKSSAR